MYTYLIAILFIFLVGYTIGRRVGIKDGFQKGEKYAPIEIRKNILQSGKCPFCSEDN